MPVFLCQIENIPLMAQGYLLLGLALYFTGIKQPRLFDKIAFYFTLLLVLALLTHLYLFIIVLVLYVAFLGDYLLDSPKHKRRCLVMLGISTTVLGVTLLIGGYLFQVICMHGYSYYPVTLLSSSLGGKLGQGLNYLGIGVLVASLCTAATRWQGYLHLITHNRVLISLLTILVLFATFNHLSYPSKEALQYPHTFSLLIETFRLDSYIFWLVSYGLMLMSLTGILRFKNKSLRTLFTLLMLVVQVYDTYPLQQAIYQTAHKTATVDASWHRLMQDVSAVHVYPSYGCGNLSDSMSHARSIAFWQSLAARHGKSINTAYIAQAQSNCSIKHRAFNKPLIKGHLYVVTKECSGLPYHVSVAMDYGWCRRTEQGIICVAHTDYNWWKNHIPSSYKHSD
jgi:hypothetical protein